MNREFEGVPLRGTFPVSGWFFIHACRRAFIPYLESEVQAALSRSRSDTPSHALMNSSVPGHPSLPWHAQEAMPGTWRCEVRWHGTQRTAAMLLAAVRLVPEVYAELTCEPTPTSEGSRYTLTPELGLWSGHMNAHGDCVVDEVRLRRVLALPADQMHAELKLLLGHAWDEILEPLRAGVAPEVMTSLRVV